MKLARRRITIYWLNLSLGDRRQKLVSTWLSTERFFPWLVKQNQAYCAETDFTPFSPATMLRVLSSCEATVRKSMQGLDYIVPRGTKGFKDLLFIVECLKDKGLDGESAQGWDVSLKEGIWRLTIRYFGLFQWFWNEVVTPSKCTTFHMILRKEAYWNQDTVFLAN